MALPIDTQFYAPRLPVNIIALPDAYDSHALRNLLEMLGCVVGVHWIGTPSDFLRVLGQGETAPRYLLIDGHGDGEKGYFLGEYAPFVDTSMLHDQYMPAKVIAPIVNLPGCTVIASVCWGGIEAMGRAFVGGGKIDAYIGCRVAPHGNDMCLFVVNFFYNILRRKLSDHDAWYKAMTMTDQPDIYKMSLFHPDGTEERYNEGLEKS